MSLAKIFKTTLSNKYTTADKLAAEYPDGVTVIGFGYAEVKGEKLPYFRVAEDGGQNFLAGGKLLNDLAAKLEAEYGTAEAIDAALQKTPQMIKIHPMMSLPNGRKFRLVEFLDEAVTGEVQEEEQIHALAKVLQSEMPTASELAALDCGAQGTPDCVHKTLERGAQGTGTSGAKTLEVETWKVKNAR